MKPTPAQRRLLDDLKEGCTLCYGWVLNDEYVSLYNKHGEYIKKVYLPTYIVMKRMGWIEIYIKEDKAARHHEYYKITEAGKYV